MALKIGAMIELKDRFSSVMKNVSKTNKKEIRNIRQSFNKLQKGIVNVSKTAAKVLIPSLIGGMKVIGDFFKSSISKYNEQIEQETKLKSVIANTKGVTKLQVSELINLSGRLEKVGVIGSEVVLAGTQQISTFQLQAETIKKLMPGMTDLIAQQKGLNATTGDAVSVGNMIGKVMAGQVGALSRAGIIFNKTQEKILKYGTEQEKAATLAEVLKANVGGVNKALRETPQGAMQGFKTTLEAIQKKLGYRLQPIVTKFLNAFIDKLPKIKKLADKLIDKIERALPTLEYLTNFILTITIKALESFFYILCKIADNWGWIKQVIKGLGFLYISIKAVQGITKAYTLAQNALTIAKGLGIVAENTTYLSILKTIGVYIWQKGILIGTTIATWGMTAATWALNGALAILTSPITWVIGAVAGLATGAYMLWKYFDWVKEKVYQLWGAFKELKIVKVYITIFKKYYDVVMMVVNAISKLINGVKNLVSSGFNKVKSFFGFGGSKEDKIQANAMGTPYFSGGLTTVNERGGELINLPSGSQIIPNDLSKKIITNNTSRNNNIVININGENKDSKSIAYEVASILNRHLNLQGGNAFG